MKSRLTLPLLVVLTIAAYGHGIHGSVPGVPTGQWLPGSSLGQPREGAVSVALDDGRVLVIGGRTATGPVATVEAFNADGSLTVVPSMSVARAGHTAVRLADGSVLVVGGTTLVATDQGTVEAATASAEVFVPASNTWSAASPLGVARTGHTATALADGRVLVAGGTGEQGPLDSMEVFEPDSAVFRAASVLSAARSEAAAAVAGKTQVLVVGGRNEDGVLATADLVDAESGAVAQVALTSPRADASATTLLDGTVFVAGGTNGANDLASAEVIDAAAGVSSAVGSMSQPRRGHQATLLDHNANVLIVGGTNAGALVGSAELFAPWTGQFTTTNPPAAPRTSAIVNSTSTEGIAVLAAGKAGSGALVAPSELYGFATVKTDKDDYPPGTTVVISGSGWQPGETVHLVLHEVATGEPDVPLIATADASGKIFNDVWAPDEHDDGVRFFLTATGVGATAQTTFTDRNPQSISVGAQGPSSSVIAGNSASYNVTVAFAGNTDPCTVTLNVTGLPTGAGFSFSPDNQPSASTPNGPINVPRTLTISTTASGPSTTLPGTYTFSVSGTNGAGCQGPGPTPGTGTLVVGASTFSVTFNASPISDVDDATQVVSVTIDGGSPTAVTKAELPKTFSGLSSGASVSYSYLSPLASITAGKQYRWNSTSGTGSALGATGQSGSFTVTSASNVSAVYVTQWQLSLATNPGAVGTSHISGLAAGGWYDAGTTASLTADANVDIVADASRYHFTAWSGASTATTVATTVLMDAANTLTANYSTQYKLTLATDSAAVGTSHISGLATDGWYDAGDTASLTADENVDIVPGASRYHFTAWSGASTATTLATTVLMDAARTLTANYVTQYKVTFDQTGIGTDTTDVILTVDGTTFTKAQLSDTRYWDTGTSWSFDSPIPTGSADKRYRRTSAASGTITGAATITGTYIAQYRLTLNTSPSGVGGAGNPSATPSSADGFYDSGTSVNVDAQSLITIDSTSRYRFDHWTGDATGTTKPVSVLMTVPKTVTANYVKQYELTFAQSGISVADIGSNPFVKVDGVDQPNAAPFSAWYDENASVAYSFYSPISTDPVSDKQYELTNGASLPSSPISVTGPATITGQYTLNTYSILYHQPMDQSSSSMTMINSGKNGRVVPVKIEFFKNGTPVQTGTVLMKVNSWSCMGSVPVDPVNEYADAGSSNANTNLFRWNGGSPGFWIYNLDTGALGLKTNACYRLDVYLDATSGSSAVMLSSSVYALFKPVK